MDNNAALVAFIFVLLAVIVVGVNVGAQRMRSQMKKAERDEQDRQKTSRTAAVEARQVTGHVP